MPLFWHPNFTVGDDVIDRDHKFLFSLINTVELVIRCPDKPANLEIALKQLYEFSVEHFQREEEMQKAIRYPDIERHNTEHINLLRQLKEIMLEVRAIYNFDRPDPVELERETNKITQTLRHWISDHVIKTDIGMKKYFEAFESKKGVFDILAKKG